MDSARFILGTIGGMIGAAVRRMFHGPKRSSWTWKFEVIIGLQRATYDLLSRIGPERYQRTLTRLLPKTYGSGAKVAVSDVDELRGHWFTPPKDNGSVILYFHGGGYVYGSAETHGTMVNAIACAASARVFITKYRLAPQHPQPAAIEDACAAYRHLVRSGISPKRIVFGGDSAGGGLIIASLVHLREAGDPLPAAAVAISPWVDLACSDPSFEYNSPYDAVTREACLVAAKAYLNGASSKSPHVSPLFADLKGLPPLLIQAGQVEVLIDQINEFAKKARSAGVEVTLNVYDDMVHVWHMLTDFTPQAQKAIDEIGAFVDRRTRD